jgi:hypothetical protein
VINDWILRDIRIGRAANADGVAYVIETGNEHNVEAEEQFHAVSKLHGLEGILRSICFVGKVCCRAIQMADLVAFYSRRHGEAMARAPLEERSDVSPEAMMSLIAGAILSVLSLRPILGLRRRDILNPRQSVPCFGALLLRVNLRGRAGRNRRSCVRCRMQ